MSSTATIYLGLDVHKESVTIAVLPSGAVAPTRVDKLPNDLTKLRRFCERQAVAGTVRACYEASGAGYVIQRAMTAWGYHCDVIAPSLIPIKPGQQRKHDSYDAAQLARLYRAGELTVVRIPTEAEERVRDVVRCRETFQREVLRSRHYILKFLARRGFVYREGTPWRPAHYTWLRQLIGVKSPLASEDRIVFAEYFALLEYKLSRRDALDHQIEEIALRPEYAAAVAPRCSVSGGSSCNCDGARHGDLRLAALCLAPATDGVPGARPARTFQWATRTTRVDHESGQRALSACAGAGRVGVSLPTQDRRGAQGAATRTIARRDRTCVESPASSAHDVSAALAAAPTPDRRGRGRARTRRLSLGGDARP